MNTRNLLKLPIKFKPWGALKLANRFTKVAAALGALIEIGMAYWEKKKEPDFAKQKGEMKQSLDSFFSEIMDDLGSTDDFIKKYLPASNLIQETIQNLEYNNSSFEKKLEESSVWKTKLFNFLDAEEISFEEV